MQLALAGRVLGESVNHNRFGPSAVKFRSIRSSWTGSPALALLPRPFHYR
jgi:hypothetical protein